MRDPVFELPRILVPRTRVNRPQEGSPRLWGGLSVLKYCSSSGVEVIFGDYLLPVVGWIGGREKSTNKGGGQAPQYGSRSAPPDKTRRSHALLARHLFYPGRRAYDAPTFCGCLRSGSHAYWSGWSAPTGDVLHSVGSLGDLPIHLGPAPEPPPHTPPERLSVGGPEVPFGEPPR